MLIGESNVAIDPAIGGYGVADIYLDASTSAVISTGTAMSAGMCPELIFPYIPYLSAYPSGSSPALSSRRKLENTGVNLLVK